MSFLTNSEKQQIAQTIREAEAQTSGELVAVIAHASDEYRYIPLLWASLIALLTPGPLLLLIPDLAFAYVYATQVGIFFVLAGLFRVNIIKTRLIPKSVKRRRASRLAWEQFFAQGLHQTREHTGVLLFVSVAERYVEIIADKGINDVVEADTWDNVVANFIGHVKQKRYAEGFIAAITDCGKVLNQHFPATHENPDELPNHLVEL